MQNPPGSPQPQEPYQGQPSYQQQPQEPYQGQPSYQQQPQQGFQGQPQQPYYPPQQPMQPGMYPPQQPPKKKSRKPLLIGCGAALVIVVVVIIVIVAAAANALKSTNTGTASNTGSGSSSQPTTSSTFKVGQLVSVGNTWQITVLSAKTDKGGQFDQPQKAGDVFMIVTVQVKNISSQEQTMSSLLQWNIQDTSGQKYNIGIDTNAGASLDGKVEAGMPLKGTLTYEVPSNVKSYVLSFQQDLISSGQTIWDITV